MTDNVISLESEKLSQMDSMEITAISETLKAIHFLTYESRKRVLEFTSSWVESHKLD